MPLETIKLEDIVPNEKNPRDDFSSVQRLAENLKATETIYGGEPINPIIVIKDGTKYRIVDGERRYRAMSSNGLEECHAIVCDGWDTADEILAAMATDDKVPLTELEKSRGLQEFMVFADEVSEAAVETVLGIEPGSVGKAAAARAKAGDEKSYNATIDQLVAAQEFSGDDGAFESIMSAGAHWPEVYKREKNEAATRRVFAELEKVIADFGIKVVDADDVPDNYKKVIWGIRNPDIIQAELAGKDPSQYICTINADGQYARGVTIYWDDSEEIDRENKQKRIVESHREMFAEGRKCRLAWLCERIEGGDGLAAISTVAPECQDNYSLMCAKTEVRDWGIKFAFPVTWQDVLIWFWNLDHDGLYRWDTSEEFYAPFCSDYLTMLDYMISDGYQPDDLETEFMVLARDFLASEDGTDKDL